MGEGKPEQAFSRELHDLGQFPKEESSCFEWVPARHSRCCYCCSVLVQKPVLNSAYLLEIKDPQQ